MTEKKPETFQGWLDMSEQTIKAEARVSGPVEELERIMRTMTMAELRVLHDQKIHERSAVEQRHKAELALFDRLGRALAKATELNGP